MPSPKMPKDLPETVKIGKTLYRRALFMVHTTHENKRTPALCKLIRDGDTVDWEGGEDWMIGYVPEYLVKPKKD